VDIDGDAIAWCTKHLKHGHFVTNAPTPPLSYPEDYFDLVYCISVFTHLNESMQDAWLTELKRILKPKGVLLVTIFGRGTTDGLDEEGKKDLKLRGFVHRRSQKLKGLLPDWYQTTWHSREYIVKRLSAVFANVHYFEVADGLQDIVGASKGPP